MASELYNTTMIAELASDAVGFVIDTEKLTGALDAHIGRIARRSTVKSSWKTSKKHGDGVVTRQAITTNPDTSAPSKLLLWGEEVRTADDSGAFLRPTMTDELVEWLREKFTLPTPAK